MHFLYPSILWALALLVIPVIIHLFYFRRFKTVHFSNVKYLKSIKEETSARSRLKNLLTLLMRLLAFTGLILAFAYPVISPENHFKQGIQAVSIFIDNSFSMQAKPDDIPLLEKAKQSAIELVNAYNQGDKFHIITNDLEGQSPFLVEQSDALDIIQNINYTPVVQSLKSIVRQQSRITKSEDVVNRTSYLLSDFQNSITSDFSVSDTGLHVNIIPIQSHQQQNVFIDSAWFETPIPLKGHSNKLIVRIENAGPDIVENVRLSIQFDGQDLPIGVLDLPGEADRLDTFEMNIIHSGWQTAKLSVNDYPIHFDDTYHIAFNVPDKIRILVVFDQQPNAKIKALYRGLSGFQADFRSASSVDYSHLSDYNLVVLQELPAFSSGMITSLSNYAQSGKNILIIPREDGNIDSYNSLLKTLKAGALSKGDIQARDVSHINDKEQIFSDVFTKIKPSLSLFQTHTSLQYHPNAAPFIEPVLSYRDHRPFMVKSSALPGLVYLIAAPLKTPYSTLANHAELFVPVMFKSAISGGASAPLSYTIGRSEWIKITNPDLTEDDVYHLVNQNVDIIPKHITSHNTVQINVSDYLKKAGIYDLTLRDKHVSKVALNYDRRESDIHVVAPKDMAKEYNVLQSYKATDIKQYVEEKEKGRPLWKWALIFALIALAIEQLIIRFWKI